MRTSLIIKNVDNIQMQRKKTDLYIHINKHSGPLRLALRKKAQ